MAAGIAAFGSILGGLLSSSGSSDAASQASSADKAAAQLQMQQYITSAGLEAPGRNLGYGADNLLAQLYGMAPVYTGPSSLTVPSIVGGVPGGSASTSATSSIPPAPTNAFIGSNPFGVPTMGNPSGTGTVPGLTAGGVKAATPASAPAAPVAPGAPDYSAFFNSPGYQWTLQQGENAVNRNAAATGGLYSANTLTNENNYAQGAASTQYNNYVAQLESMAGLGQSATSATVNAGTADAEGASNSLISAGNANASGVLGAAGGINNALTGNNGLLAALRNSNNSGGNFDFSGIDSELGGSTNLNYNLGGT